MGDGRTVRREVALYLARHGQSVANAERWISSWEPIGLTEEGTRQARELGERLKRAELPLAGILASDLARAMQTAELVNRALALEIAADEGLRERHYGDWTGLGYEEIEARLGDQWGAWRNDDEAVAPGGESRRAHRERAAAAVRRGLERWGGDPFLVISHRGTMRVLVQHAQGGLYDDTPIPPNPPEFTRVAWPDDGNKF